MKKNTLLYILLVFLVVMNAFFMFKIFGDKPPRGSNPGNFIAKELQFDEAQMKAFKQINDMHHKEMMGIMKEVRMLKDELFDYIAAPNHSEAKVSELTQAIGDKIRLRDEKTFYHFKEVKKICTDKQKIRFNKLVQEALRRPGKGGGMPSGKPPGM